MSLTLIVEIALGVILGLVLMPVLVVVAVLAFTIMLALVAWICDRLTISRRIS